MLFIRELVLKFENPSTNLIKGIIDKIANNLTLTTLELEINSSLHDNDLSILTPVSGVLTSLKMSLNKKPIMMTLLGKTLINLTDFFLDIKFEQHTSFYIPLTKEISQLQQLRSLSLSIHKLPEDTWAKMCTIMPKGMKRLQDITVQLLEYYGVSCDPLILVLKGHPTLQRLEVHIELNKKREFQLQTLLETLISEKLELRSLVLDLGKIELKEKNIEKQLLKLISQLPNLDNLELQFPINEFSNEGIINIWRVAVETSSRETVL